MGVVDRDGALMMAAGIDNSGLKKDAKDAEDIIDEVGTESEKTGKRMNKAFESMESAINSTRETIIALEKTISSLNNKLDKKPTDTKKVKELEAALDDLRQKYEKVEQSLIANSRETKELESSLEGVKQKYDKVTQSVAHNQKEIRSASEEAKKATSDYDSLANSLKNAWKALGIGLSVAGVKSFASEIINVRGEMEALESSFEVLLGGKGVAGFLAELKKFAVDSPLSMTGVSNAAQTLLGFNIEAEKVIPIIKQIGDISMGNEQKFNSLILAFAQMSSTGKLTGQDLMQMINAGFNPLSVIAEKTGKSIGELKKEMESGSISSEMIANAFASATAEGGKFYGMTQKQAEGVNGLKAQLEGGIQDALNDIGKSQEDLIAGGYKLAISLVENYETVGKVIMALVATYGTYKAALITINALEKVNIAIMRQAVLEKQTSALANVKLTSAEAYQIASKKLLTIHTKNLTRALKTQALAMVTNPALLFTAAIVGAGLAVYKMATYSTEAEKAQKRLNDAIRNAEKASLSETRELAKLKGELSATTKGTNEYNKVKDKIVKGYGKYYSGLEQEIDKVGLLETTYNNLTKAIQRSFGARQYDSFMKSEQENLDSIMSENLGKIQDRLIEKLGDEAGAKYYTNIRKAIMDGTVKASSSFYGVDGLDKETQNELNKISGKATNDRAQNFAIEGYIRNILKAQAITNELEKRQRINSALMIQYLKMMVKRQEKNSTISLKR